VIQRLFLYSALSCVAGFAAVPASAQVSDERAAAFIEAAELDRSTVAFAAQFRQLLLMQANQFPPPAAEAYREEFTAALSDENIEARLRAYIGDHVKAEALEAALSWREDPAIAPRMARLDSASADPRAQVPVQMYGTTGRLGRHEVTPDREALARRYVEVTGTGAAAVELMADLVVASNQLSARLLQAESPSEEALRAEVARQFGIEGAIPIRGYFLYAFRDVADDEVAAFVEASDSDAARLYGRLVGAAMSYAVVGAISAAGAAFLGRLAQLDAAGDVDLEAWRDAARAQMRDASHVAGAPPPAADDDSAEEEVTIDDPR
jgi:hypothetical protein